MKTIYVDLMLDTGELVRIEAPAGVDDDLYESLENAMKRGDWWSPGLRRLAHLRARFDAHLGAFFHV